MTRPSASRSRTSREANERRSTMTSLTTRIARLVLAPSLLFVACASPEGRVGLETFGRGITNLMLSPVMIVAGLAQGLAFLPYTIGVGLTDLNKALLQASAV